jgi:hypothetical protein
MNDLLGQLQDLGDGKIDDLSIAHDAREEIMELRMLLQLALEQIDRLKEESI